MVSTACYPYPVNEKTTTRRAAMRPYIYSPSDSHSSSKHIMYPHPNLSGSPSPNYIYSGYDQYYSKNSWASATPGSWPTFYPHPLSSSLPETTVNPKVTILPPQPVLVSDIDTPSSLSSHSILTPSSPFARHDVGEPMEFDEFDDDEDYIDSDFADEMEGIDEPDSEDAFLYSPPVIKSTSALEGALGDTPADRRLSASVPASHHRQSSSPYTHRNHASLTSLPSPYVSLAPSPRLPILQPQPIRPIPPIPIADLTSSVDDGAPLPLLCQPVSDAVRFKACDATASDRFTQDGTFCQAHPSTDGTCSVGKKVYSCGCVDLQLGWR